MGEEIGRASRCPDLRSEKGGGGSSTSSITGGGEGSMCTSLSS